MVQFKVIFWSVQLHRRRFQKFVFGVGKEGGHLGQSREFVPVKSFWFPEDLAVV